MRTSGIADDDEIAVQLLADIRNAFESEGADRLSTERLLLVLCSDKEAPWATWRRGDPITPRTLGTMMRGFGIRSRTVRLEDGTARGFLRTQFDDAWKRYAPDSAFVSDTSDTTQQPSHKQSISEVTQDPFVSDTKTGANPHGSADVSDVSDRDSKTGGNAKVAGLSDLERARLFDEMYPPRRVKA